MKNYLSKENECPFILDFYGGFLEQSYVKNFLEFMDGGNLR